MLDWTKWLDNLETPPKRAKKDYKEYYKQLKAQFDVESPRQLSMSDFLKWDKIIRRQANVERPGQHGKIRTIYRKAEKAPQYGGRQFPIPDKFYEERVAPEELQQMFQNQYHGKNPQQLRQFTENMRRVHHMENQITDNREGLLQDYVANREQVDPGVMNKALQLRLQQLTSTFGPWHQDYVHARSMPKSHTQFTGRDTAWEREDFDFKLNKPVKQATKMTLPGDKPVHHDILNDTDPDWAVFDPRIVHIPSKFLFFIFYL